MKNVITLFLLLTVSYAISQELKATIYLRDGASYDGYGYIYGQNKIKFRFEDEEDYEVFTDLLVKEVEFFFYRGSNLYRYIDLKSNFNYRLLKVLVEGEYTLYAKMKNSYTNNNKNKDAFFGAIAIKGRTEGVYYLNRKNESNFTLIQKLGKKRKIRSILNDCEDFTSRYDDGEFQKNTLTEIVDYYNDFCVD